MKPERQQLFLRHIEISRTIDGELFHLRKRAIDLSMVSTRGLQDYSDYLGFNPEFVRDKVVLDVGSGPGVFAEEAEEFGAEVVSLDPKPGIECENMSDYERQQLRDRVIQGKITYGIAQELPFADSSFDLVTALMSVPNYLPDTESEKQLALLEMARVLKPGGEARIFPVLQLPHTHISITEHDLWLLNSHGYRTKFESASSVADITRGCPVFAPVASLMTGFDRMVIEKP